VKFLLDTCTFLWIAEDSPRLSSGAREMFLSSENIIYLSSISVAEICIKFANAKLDLKIPPQQLISQEKAKNGLLLLPFEASDSFHLASLPLLHKDPFDRMLVCQALTNDLTILTPDPLIRQYAISTLW
jgi:PIN domain nuclease of toxin-antitoxin system